MTMLVVGGAPTGIALTKVPSGMRPGWSLESKSTEIEESQGKGAALKVACTLVHLRLLGWISGHGGPEIHAARCIILCCLS